MDFGSRSSRWGHAVADRLGATGDQREVLLSAANELREELRSIGSEARGTRVDLGRAFGPERFDEEQMGELFAVHDELLERARKAVIGALARIHEVLEPNQRERLSRWIGGRGGFGPYRD